jgi:hypothetical protein
MNRQKDGERKEREGERERVEENRTLKLPW